MKPRPAMFTRRQALQALSAAVVSALAPARAFAAPARELSTVQTIRIDAPAERVWALLSDFGGIAKWFRALQGSRLVLKTRNEVGAIRELHRGNGTRVREKLVALDPAGMMLAYEYADGDVLASDYHSEMTVKPIGDNACEVVWTGRFTRRDYWIDPAPEGQDDASLVALYDRIYKAALVTLKQVAETPDA
jgi:mxaD protein